MSSLVEIDAVEVIVINDNELDPMSPYLHPGLQVSGQFKDLAMGSPHYVHERGAATKEIRMEDLCCGSHGLSLMIVRNNWPATASSDRSYARLPSKEKRDVLFCSTPVLKRMDGNAMLRG